MSQPPVESQARVLLLAVVLSFGAAISLGITRFAYALLLPPMRADLQWSYALAGAMNTANAVGYLVGALLTPALLRRSGPSSLLIRGAWLASVFMALSGFFTDPGMLLLQRLLAGVASAFVLVAGSLLAVRLGALNPARSGLLIGLYYGGTGIGILLSALLVPALLEAASGHAHGWALSWWGLALVCVAATIALLWPARVLARPPAGAGVSAHATAPAPIRFRWRDFAPSLTAYGLFGVGYIGYMTFVIALLREQGVGPARLTLFYALLGLACVASSRLWAGLLDRFAGGQPLTILSALLGVAILIPALTAQWAAVLVSGLLFGAVFLSVVGSTTALVRHNLPASEWTAGISAFTVVFAAGQIAGPAVVGWIADGEGGLARGLLFSAAALWLGAAIAWRQRPLAGRAPRAATC